MTFLSKGTLVLTLALAASTGLFSDGGTGTVSAQEFDILSGAEALQPLDIWDTGPTKRLLVAYADVEGHARVVERVDKSKSNDKGSSKEVANVEFQKNHKLKKKKGEKGSEGREGKEDNKTGKKGKRRSLVQEGADISGYSVLEVEVEDLDAEMAALSALEGVTAVEEDGEMHIEQKLRGGGGGANHIREIQDAIKAAALEFPEDEVEFSPNLDLEGEDETHGRRLAESTPYGIDMVNVSHLWSIPPVRATPITICVVDTGYDEGHPDLPNMQDHNVTGWNAVNSDGTFPFDKWNIDGNGHGTHCAGTIGAIGNNGIGVTSVNPNPSNFKFFIGKGLSDTGSGSNSNVNAAVLECVNAGAKVISMSLGGTGRSDITEQFYADQYDKDVLIIAAAGNSGRVSDLYPSAYETVMSVASVDSSRKLSLFSTRNGQVEIAAPGSFVLSTYKGDTYKTLSGTSMATPHVAGVAALLWSHFPLCTNNQIRNAMIHSASEPPTNTENTAGWDTYYGWGIVNAGMAYDLLKQGCEVAGGLKDPTTVGEGLSSLALGGKDQLDVGCTKDEHCPSDNPCLGQFFCNAANACELISNTKPVCNDNIKCTIDTCDPSKTIVTSVEDLCVHTPKPCEDGNKCNGVKACDELTGNCVEIEPVINCDDGNACTIDTCVTASGNCTHADRTCDDNNFCTKNDTCIPETGCVFQLPVPDCCGNAECEADETEMSCPLDCGDSLTTSFDTSLARSVDLGPMFDIKTKSKNVTIAGFDLNCNVPDGIPSTVSIYSLEGGNYGDHWYKKSMWTLVKSGSINCQGFGTPTPVTLDTEVHVAKESKHAFKILLYTDADGTGYWFDKGIYPTGKTARYTPYQEDSYVQIQTGGGNYCISGWCGMVSPRAPAITIHYAVINDNPTMSPTMSSMPTTPLPTFTPTTKPTPAPTTLSPTPVPTSAPTPAPTASPTETPSNSPSVSMAPTPFESIKVTIASPPTNSASTLNSFYFDVSGGDHDSVITNMKLTTYASSQSIRVFAKHGIAKGSQATPCDWELVAETAIETTGYWKLLYPKWKYGFKHVELMAGETVAFYVVSNNRLLGKYEPSSMKYTNLFTTDSAHVLPGTRLSIGEYGSAELFKPYPEYYSSRAFMGSLDLETVAPGFTMSPSSAPTGKFSSKQVQSSDPADSSTYHGIQFDIHTTSTIVLRKLSMNVQPGTHFVEVWYRIGSYKGTTSGCDNWNNWCNQWIKAAGGDVTSVGENTLTDSPALSIIASEGDTIGVAIVFPHSLIVAGTSRTSAEAADDTDGVITILPGSKIEDYYGDEVNTIHALDSASIDYKGKIDYDMANSFCATVSAYNGVMSGDDLEPDEPDEVFNPNGPSNGGPPQENVDELGEGFDSLS